MTRDELFSLKIAEPDSDIKNKSKARWDSIAKPIDGLGDFEDIISRMAAVQGNVFPKLDRKALIIMCADNGIFEEGVGIRLVGVGVDHLDNGTFRQGNLFDWMTTGQKELQAEKEKKEKDDKLEKMEKSIRDKFGDGLIHKGF